MTPRTFRPALVALAAAACALAGSAVAAPVGSTRLPPDALAAIRARQPQTTALARRTLLDARAGLGLDADAGFEPRLTFTDAEGRTVVRLRQTHRGHPVFSGEAIVHVEADGTIRTHTRGVKALAMPAGEPRIGSVEAVALALHRLAPRGPLVRPATAELVVFPSRLTGGIVTTLDRKSTRPVLDRDLSVWAHPPAAPAVWAWKVDTLLVNRLDGHKELSYMVDAATGAILRVDTGIAASAPATGTGHSFYRGDVALSTTQLDDGTYELVSPLHGTLPNPFVLAQGIDWTGMTTTYSWFHTDTYQEEFDKYPAKATDEWGNGQALPFPWDPVMFAPILDTTADGLEAWAHGALDPTGETAAVDAHFGLCATWDFYREVMGRDGIDGSGSSTFAVVHAIMGGQFMADNAFWSNDMFGMFFGDGTYPVFGDQGLMTATTEIDITGHELTHGVTFGTAGLHYAGESGALNEATSDMLGKMVEAWAGGGASGPTVPDFPAGDLTPWEIGRHSVPDGRPPLRYMYKPSKDLVSQDEWFDGLDQTEVHYGSGVGNRFYFFLAAGGSSDPASDTYSVYLPGGMAGIGNEKAAHIWYRTVTEYLGPDSDYAAARDASVQAAADLHGAGSAEQRAVELAWAAVNVGSAPGEPPRVRVRIPIVHPPGTFLYDNAVPEGILEKVQIFPTRTRVRVTATVENTNDTGVRIEAPIDSQNGWAVGTVNADGSWTTPWWPYYADLVNVIVRSDADPKQYARTRLLLMELDGNTDGEMDVFDLAATAMEWGLPSVIHQPVATAGGGAVDDWDVVFWTEAFQNGFPAAGGN
jgi:Zn-dependent metalloprotease